VGEVGQLCADAAVLPATNIMSAMQQSSVKALFSFKVVTLVAVIGSPFMGNSF
jgi:hypothetical protein